MPLLSLGSYLPDVQQDAIFSLGLDLNLESFKSLTLSVFDFRSCVERKNPELLLDVFSISTCRIKP